MTHRLSVALAAILLVGLSVVAFAGNVRTDYDHSANFAQYKSYSWGKVQTSNPFYVSRIKQAVDKELQAKGWQLVESGGSVMIFATDSVHDQKQVQTMYDGLATENLSNNSDKNTKSLDGDINNMFKRFPPKPGS
jgi:hypothetical protein